MVARDACATIAEMEPGKKGRRGEGLLARIQKLIAVYRSTPAVLPAQSRVVAPVSGGEGFVKNQEAYPKGAAIFREGDSGECMYAVRRGSVGIYAGYGTPEERLLTTLGRGQFFGEMGMIEKKARSAAAVALENGTVVETICESDLKELSEKNINQAFMILQHLSVRLRRLTEDYLRACATVGRIAEAEAKNEEVDPAVLAQAKAFSLTENPGRFEYL